MHFVKLQALGNDYVCLDLTGRSPTGETSKLARSVTDRRRGVGADGLLCIHRGVEGRLRMGLYNADGSRA